MFRTVTLRNDVIKGIKAVETIWNENMFRWKSLRSSLLFCGICFILLLLNKSLIEVYDNREKRIPVNDVISSRDDGSLHADTPCNPAILPIEVSRLKKTASKARCIANNGKEMNCMYDGNEYYFPFSFIKKQYDVSGKLSKEITRDFSDGSRFELFTSYSKIRVPDGDFYDPVGLFGHFATYSVETRERVRCISAQTANKSYDEEIVMGLKSTEWKGSAGMHETSERIFYSDDERGNIVNVTTAGDLSNAGCYIFLDPSPRLHVLLFDWLPIRNASFTILVRLLESDTLVLLNYVTLDNPRCVWSDLMSFAGTEQLSFSFSLGQLPRQWHSVTRDVLVDVSRALSSMNTNKKKEGNVVIHPGDIKLVSLGFRGITSVRQRIHQAQNAHRKFFLTAADWLCSNQNKEGGWAVPVERAIADRRLTLNAGWHSAMAQGHALSLLTRAYAATRNVTYLTVATEALKLFEKDAVIGGVRSMLFDHVWFEEYPTTPGSFVLNGFMYSLIGLYDFKSVQLSTEVPAEVHRGLERASLLFTNGMESLRALIPLYDTGSGSLYDLRHVGLHTAPNLARWDYHAVHVYLLKWLVQISGDKILNDTANRWIEYSWGKKAKHN
uniref:heparosan-N-sulfate-glucuronate 5-epimerase n=1 Tax=Angiostrongylus cantonensis TaxID=6313 RepID=A0A158P839_ANGCA